MVNDIKKLKVILSGLCLLLGISSCITLDSKQGTGDFFYRAEKNISERCYHWTTFEAQLLCKLKFPTFSNKYLLSIRKDRDLLRLDLTSLWGNTLAVVVVKKGEAILWLPLEKTVYKSLEPDTFLEKIVGIEGRLTDILALVTGCFEASKIQLFNVSSIQPPFPTLSMLTVRQKDQNWKVHYSPPFALFPVELTPKIITINTPTSELTFEVKGMEKRPEIPHVTFDLSYPPQTLVKEL
ncbi:MAG: hypothetical protein N2260_01175 [Syntrophobacterales bacterium]|nr:hypothetical protein [Syntrophobacterales bacterium]